MASFIVGFLIGGWCGFIAMAMCAASGRASEMEGYR